MQLQSGDEQTETLQILDASTGESVVIVAERSIVELVREQQLTFDSQQGESSLQKIKDLIIAAGQGRITASTPNALESKGLLAASQVGVHSETVDVSTTISENAQISVQGDAVVLPEDISHVVGTLDQGTEIIETVGQGLEVTATVDEESDIIENIGQEVYTAEDIIDSTEVSEDIGTDN